eukprot:PhM_4_TR10260/c0_g1_i1/m.66433/K12862/PLRG1, PRL1, PRP46; pleiotropic regulator 1
MASLLAQYTDLVNPTALLSSDTPSPSLAASLRATSVRIKRAREYAATDSGDAADVSRRTLLSAVKSSQSATSAAAASERSVIPIDPTKLRDRDNMANKPAPAHQVRWKRTRVITGLSGIAQSLCVDSSNDFFIAGMSDCSVKCFDLATMKLRVTLPGHVEAVRGVCLSRRLPYLFSCGEDKSIKCWDLETNTVVRDYHGHMSGVYAISAHPDLDVIFSGGGDGAVRVWDVRTRCCVHMMLGHSGAVNTIASMSAEPQVVSGGTDATVRLWDLCSGKTREVLTHHKRGVRAVVHHPTEYTFASCSAESMRKWRCPEGTMLHSFELGGHDIITSAAVNEAGVCVSGHTSGALRFYDWPSASCFQVAQSTPQAGSHETEGCIQSVVFDQSGTRLLTAQGDKTLYEWRHQKASQQQ